MELTNNSKGNITSVAASDRKNRKPLTPQELVRDNVHFLAQQLEAGQSEALTDFLNAMARFRNYSFGNQLLIARQKPNATHVAGMRTWNELGRRVKRGEKGIAILAPMIGKIRKKPEPESQGEETRPSKTTVLGFRRVFVWDEEQTEGAPLPNLGETTGDVGEYLDRLRDFVAQQGITLELTEDIAPALGVAFGSTIRLLPGQTKPEEFLTLVHELTHIMLKHTERRTAATKAVRETEAEAVAFVVAKAINLEAKASASYIQLWHGDVSLLLESLEVIQQTAAVILSAIQTDEPVPTDQSTPPEAVTEPQSTEFSEITS